LRTAFPRLPLRFVNSIARITGTARMLRRPIGALPRAGSSIYGHRFTGAAYRQHLLSVLLRLAFSFLDNRLAVEPAWAGSDKCAMIGHLKPVRPRAKHGCALQPA
jgi:hypothetical protein